MGVSGGGALGTGASNVALIFEIGGRIAVLVLTAPSGFAFGFSRSIRETDSGRCRGWAGGFGWGGLTG